MYPCVKSGFNFNTYLYFKIHASVKLMQYSPFDRENFFQGSVKKKQITTGINFPIITLHI